MIYTNYTLAVFCKRARILAGMTQEEWAEHCGTSKTTVSRWETGQQTPRLDHIAIMRTAIRKAHPQMNKRYISVCPVIKFVCAHDDLTSILAVSQGYIDAAGFSDEAIQTCDVPVSDHWKEVDRRCRAHPAWDKHQVAYFLVTLNSARVGWITHSGSILPDGRSVLIEGRQLSPREVVTAKFNLQIFTYDDLKESPAPPWALGIDDIDN